MGYQRRVHGDFSTHLYNTRLPKTIMLSLTQTAAAQSVRVTAPKRDGSRRAQAKNGGGNFSAPPRDDSETFSNSLAGQSNWNAYEGSAEKALTQEELKAKNAKEDAEAAARKAAAIKANQEYAKKNGA